MYVISIIALCLGQVWASSRTEIKQKQSHRIYTAVNELRSDGSGIQGLQQDSAALKEITVVASAAPM